MYCFISNVISTVSSALKQSSYPVMASDDSWVHVAILALKAAMFTYDVITFPVYLLWQQPWKKLANSRKKKAISITGRPEGPYRTIDHPSLEHEDIVSVDTLKSMYEVFASSVVKNGPKSLFGTRQVFDEIEELQPNGKLFKKLLFGDYHYETYDQVSARVDTLARALHHLGVRSPQNVVIFAETRAEWMLSCIACFKANLSVVTLYATLGEEAIVHGINETETPLVITSRDLLPKFKTLLKKTPLVKHVIYMEGLRKMIFDGFPETVEYHSFSDVETMGSQVDEVIFSLPTENDRAIIMYTSGSTGVPKGVVITHKNLLASLSGLSYVISAKERNGDGYLAYLPLAHVLELLIEFMCLVWGTRVGYSSPLTISDQSSKIMKGCKGDATFVQPTVLASVPLILDRIYMGINDVVSSRGAFSKAFFKLAVDYKLYYAKKGFQTPLLDRLLFKKLQKMLGGRLGVIIAGGAALSPETMNFVRVCMGCPVLQGYGLTETCATATVMNFDDMSVGRVGGPVVGCEVMLEDWEEGSYRVTDKPYPRGEILVGGDHVAAGYYKLDALTKEDFFERHGTRWFRTGDIGEVHPDGVFKIIDRKKDLVKLQAGEYLSLGKVESGLKTLSVVENVCVYGDAFKSSAVALIVPQIKVLQQIAKDIGKGHLEHNELCADAQVTKTVEKLVADHCRKIGLERFETPTKIKLITETWLPDSGLVTAAYKLKRKNIQDFYRDEIDKMYKS